MKIVIDMYGLGFKMHDLTEDQILMAVGRQPQYRERIYFWGEKKKDGQTCNDCSLKTECDDDLRGIEYSTEYCSNNQPSNFNLQPYFKKEVI